MPITILDLVLLAVMLISGLARDGARLHARNPVDRGMGAAAVVTLYAFSKLLATAKTYFTTTPSRRDRGRRRVRRHPDRGFHVPRFPISFSAVSDRLG